MGKTMRPCIRGGLADEMCNIWKSVGWDGRIRTYDLRYQKALPYH